MTKIIFGYGSLMNLQSLKKTVPDAKSIFPALLKNYIRVFETKSTTRLSKQNTSICVLNIKESQNSFLNGIGFEVSEKYFNDLLKRESSYELREIVVQSLISGEEFSAFVFVDKFNKNQKFLFDEPVQMDYLRICIDGAKDFGEDFYQMFLETTFIDGCKLRDVEGLGELLCVFK
jgi:cation transport regulator ChaC